MKKLLLLFLLLLILAFPTLAAVDIGEIGIGARPLGMGSAFVSGIADATAVFTNPAALALSQNFNIVSMSGSLFTDVNYLMVGCSEKTPVGNVGIGYLNSSVAAIPIVTVEGTGSTRTISQVSTTNYSSSIVYFSYGTKLNKLLKNMSHDFVNNVFVGGNLKLFFQGFSGGGAIMNGATGTGMDADLGLLWKVKPWARLGLTVNNFLPASLGGRFLWQRDNSVEGIPYALRLGGGFNILGNSSLYYHSDQQLKLSLDYENGRGTSRPALWHTGLEYWPVERVAFRVGIDQRAKATQSGIGTDSNLTAGVGLKFNGFTFDYAYHKFGELDANTTHFFSLGYRGGDEEKESPRPKNKTLPIATVVVKPKLITFKDVPNSFWAARPIEYLATLGIMNGAANGKFYPQDGLTRSDLAVILVRAKGLKVKGGGQKTFSDVNSKSWIAPYINLVVKKMYMNGYPDKTFRPNKMITRAEAAVILANFSGLYVKSRVQRKVYPDVALKHWAAPAIAADKQIGLFEYLGTGNFKPQAYLTRAELAEMLAKTPTVKYRIKKLISGG